MASGTTVHTVDRSAWVRLDAGDVYLTGIVLGGPVSLAYMSGTSAPGTLTETNVLPLEAGEKFNFEMGTGESLWALSRSGVSKVSVIRRAA